MNKHFWCWFACCICAILHQIVQYILKVHVPFVDGYLDPFLFYPVVLGAILLERKWWFGKHYILSRKQILIYFIILTIIVEVIFPYLDSRFIFDYWDIIPYFLGVLFFERVLNKKY